MKRIVKVATEATTFLTIIGYDRRKITVVDGEIVRIIIRPSGAKCTLHIRANSNLEFDDCSDYEEKKPGYLYSSITYKEKGSIYYGAALDKLSESDFDTLCRNEIRLLSEHNVKELRNLFDVLKDGKMKDECRKCQEEILELLNF